MRASLNFVPALSGRLRGQLQGFLQRGAPDTALCYTLSNSDVECGPNSLVGLNVKWLQEENAVVDTVARKG